MIEVSRKPLTLSPVQPGTLPEQFGSTDEALAWLSAERTVLAEVATVAGVSGPYSHASQFARVLSTFLDRYGYRHEYVVIVQTALAAARRMDDPYAQAQAERKLGIFYGQKRQWVDAHLHLQRALNVFATLGKHAEQAAVHMTLAAVIETQRGSYHEALQHAEQALELSVATEDRIGHARALNQIGWFHTHLGNPRATLEYCEQALAIQHEIGDTAGAANTWDTLGWAQYILGDPGRAVDCYRKALNLYNQSDVRIGRAETLDRLGDAHLAVDDTRNASNAWQQAVSIFDEIGDARADRVRAKIDSLASASDAECRPQ